MPGMSRAEPPWHAEPKDGEALCTGNRRPPCAALDAAHARLGELAEALLLSAAVLQGSRLSETQEWFIRDDGAADGGAVWTIGTILDMADAALGLPPCHERAALTPSQK